MDINKIIDCLRATLNPDTQSEAERQLVEINKIISFVPSLLQIVMHDQLEMPIRQAGS